MGKQRAHSVGSAAGRRPAVTRVLSSKQARSPRSTMYVRWLRPRRKTDSRGDDASEVVREVVRRVEASLTGNAKAKWEMRPRGQKRVRM